MHKPALGAISVWRSARWQASAMYTPAAQECSYAAGAFCQRKSMKNQIKKLVVWHTNVLYNKNIQQRTHIYSTLLS